MALKAYDLELIEEVDDIEDGIEEAIEFDDFTEAAETIIRVIHRVPQLHDYDFELGEIEFYLGRTSEGNVFGRFRVHKANYDHAVIVGKGSLRDVQRWERGGIRVLTGLKSQNSLCCANISKGHGGGEASGEQYIYLCWRFVNDQGIGSTTMNELRKIAEDVANKAGIDFDEAFEALKTVKRQSETEPVRWASGHNPN